MRGAGVTLIPAFTLALMLAALPVQTAANEQARALANQHQTSLETLAKTTPDASTIPGFAGKAVPQAGFTADMLANPDTIQKTKAQRQAGQAILDAPTPITLDPDKYKSALKVQADPDTVFDLDSFLSGSYADCKVVTTPSTASGTHHCNAWRGTASQDCSLHRQIEVDADVKYNCAQDSPRIHKTCTRTLTRSCGTSSACTDIGLDVASIDTDMRFEALNNGRLRFGTLGDNYWGGWCTIYNRTIRFNVNKHQPLTRFALVQLNFDDWIQLKVNGHLVYVGASGSTANGEISVDSRRVSRTDCYGDEDRCSTTSYNQRFVSQGGKRLGSCERKRNWHRNTDIDLRPWLQEGENRFEMRVIVSDRGEGSFEIEAQARCCDEWQETWGETCD